MTEQAPPCDSLEGQTGAKFEITPAMIQAGVEALSEVSLAQPLCEIAEKTFVAMFYASDLASSIKALT